MFTFPDVTYLICQSNWTSLPKEMWVSENVMGSLLCHPELDSGSYWENMKTVEEDAGSLPGMTLSTPYTIHYLLCTNY